MLALSVRLQEGRSLCNINTTFGRGAIRELRSIYWQENLHSFIEPNCRSNAAMPKLLSSLLTFQMDNCYRGIYLFYVHTLNVFGYCRIYLFALVPFIFSFQKEKMVHSCFEIIWIEPGSVSIFK